MHLFLGLNSFSGSAMCFFESSYFRDCTCLGGGRVCISRFGLQPLLILGVYMHYLRLKDSISAVFGGMASVKNVFYLL